GEGAAPPAGRAAEVRGLDCPPSSGAWGVTSWSRCGLRRIQLTRVLPAGLRSLATAGVRCDGGRAPSSGAGTQPSPAVSSAPSPPPAQPDAGGAPSSGSSPSGSLPSSQASKILRAIGAAVLPP